MLNQKEVLLDIEDLRIYFYTDDGIVRAVDGVSLQSHRGKTLGIVGESGCGKTVTARSVLQIVSVPGRIVGGRITFHRPRTHDDTIIVDELVLTDLPPKGKQIQRIRGDEIAMIFQEPMSAFSPVHTIGTQISETVRLHNSVSKEEARQRALEVLRQVGMPEAERNLDRYPHQLSGGMCQRAMIAMALSCEPTLLIADEPTTALDVTTEAQILELLLEVQQSLGMTIMYITHDLGVIAQIADEVCVMYLGKVVERAPVDALFYDPKHPYTKALLRSIPRIGYGSDEWLETIVGNVPDPYSLPSGCRFHPRCPSFMEGICDVREPDTYELGEGHTASCHLYKKEQAL